MTAGSRSRADAYASVAVAELVPRRKEFRTERCGTCGKWPTTTSLYLK
jgi:hypothetical protein